jgi:hypothetical protein
MKPNICILSDIFKSLGVNKSDDYASYLYKTEKFNIFSKMCQNSLHKKQKGGNRITINYEGIDFEFSKYKDDEYTMISLYARDNNVDCITIRIDKMEKIAIILGIGYFPMCFTNRQIKHFKGKTSGTLLLKLSLKLLDEMKEHYGYNKITLQDNSYKQCHKYTIELSLMSTLMHGETWYGKYGFVPAHDDKIDKQATKDYEKNKFIMNSKKMQDFPDLKKYIEKSFENVEGADDFLIKKESIMKLYDKYYQKNMLIKDFIKKFLEKYDKSCLLFYTFYKKIYKKLGLINFYKQSYVKYV